MLVYGTAIQTFVHLPETLSSIKGQSGSWYYYLHYEG